MDRGRWWVTILGVAKSDTTEQLAYTHTPHTHTHTHTHTHKILEHTAWNVQLKLNQAECLLTIYFGNHHLVNFSLFLYSLRLSSQMALVINNPPASRKFSRHRFHPLIRKIPWRRAWQHTPVFLTGESHGQRSLNGYST